MKILVIDDASFIFKAIKTILEPYGVEIVGHAINGEVGLEMYEQYKPDIITLDVNMPVMDGIETAKHLLGKNPLAKIIMISLIDDDNIINEVKNIGVSYFLNKPFSESQLINAINSILKQNKQKPLLLDCK